MFLQAAQQGGAPAAEQYMFWILAALALCGALGLVLSRNAIHSAMSLVLTMLSLGSIYIVQSAEFLGVVQIVVYTGAIMMLFLFVIMMTGREAGDSTIELLRGQKIAAITAGIGFVGLMVTGLVRALQTSQIGSFDNALAQRGPIGSIAKVIFTDYVFPFELTSALLIVAALGAMVLAHVERKRSDRRTQRRRVVERMRSPLPAPQPGPGVMALSHSAATPGLLPDGSIAEGSVSDLVDRRAAEADSRTFQDGAALTEVEAVQLRRAVTNGAAEAGDGGSADADESGPPPDADDGPPASAESQRGTEETK